MTNKELLNFKLKNPNNFTQLLRTHYKQDYNNVLDFCKENNLICETFSHSLYHYINKLKEYPRCKTCNKHIKTFNRLSTWSYGNFCSSICALTNKTVKEKALKSSFLVFKNRKNKINSLINNILTNDNIKFISKDKLIETLKNISKIEDCPFTIKLIYNFPEIYKTLNNYFNLKIYNISEIIYIILNNNFKFPICQYCNERPRIFINFKQGYRNHCNNKTCIQLYRIDIQNGLAKTRINNHFDNIKEIIKKQNFTILNNINVYNGLVKTKIKLKCNICNAILEKDLSNGRSENIVCSGCFGKSGISKNEKKIVKYIKSIYNQKIKENHKFHKYKTNFKELDIFLPDKNIGIEYNGLHWHSEVYNLNKLNLLSKTILCESKNIKLIHILEDEWLFKEKIVKSRLKHILGLIKYSIGARECEIKTIDVKLKNKFLNKYHIQGEDKSAVYLGAFYKNRLIGVMTFGKLRKALGQNAEVGSYELIRFCTIASFNFPGIASKFLKYFETNYKPTKIISYADRRWSQGDLYKNLGFTFVKYSKPNYWYFKGIKRYHRFNFRKNILKDKLEVFDPNKTEWENMQANDWDRIWDCGNYVFIKSY